MGETDADRDPESAALLRAFLAGRDVECPQCQYNLRDQLGDRCPECGEQIVLRLNLAEPKLGAMIAGLVGLSAGAGLSGLLLIYIAIQAVIHRIFGGFWKFFSINAIGLLVEGIAVIFWIAYWRKIRHATAHQKAGYCWSSPAGF